MHRIFQFLFIKKLKLNFAKDNLVEFYRLSCGTDGIGRHADYLIENIK